MMSASKQVKLLGAAQSLIAGITDAFRTATIDHSKVFEVMALRSAITDTMAALMVFSAKPSPKCGNERI